MSKKFISRSSMEQAVRYHLQQLTNTPHNKHSPKIVLYENNRYWLSFNALNGKFYGSITIAKLKPDHQVYEPISPAIQLKDCDCSEKAKLLAQHILNVIITDLYL